MPGTLSKSIRVVSRSYLLLLSLFVTGCSDISTQIVIPASPLEVWKVLVDTQGYQDWNPTWRPKEGSLQQGAYIKYDYIQPGEDPIEMRFIVGKSVRPMEPWKSTSPTWANFVWGWKKMTWPGVWPGQW